jgi:hypothetical protein
MDNTNAKIQLSLNDGTFEISGSESFVSQQIENFKEIILATLHMKPRTELQSAPPPPVHTLELSANEAQLTFEKKTFQRILHIEDQSVRIIKKMPGSNNAQKTITTALVYLWGKKSVGVNEVPIQEIRALCQEQGCLDSSNFSSQIQGAKELILVDGKKNSSSKTCKLTLPGVERAEEILEKISN